MDNPYQLGAYSSSYPVATGQVSPGVIQALSATKPWVRLCSVMGFILTGFMVLGSLGIIGGGLLGNSPRFGSAGVEIIVGVIYIVISLLYVIPSIKLWKYGSAILRLISTNSAADLEQALKQQSDFWKFVGILVIISAGFMILTILIAGFAAR